MIEEGWHDKSLHGEFVIRCKDADADQVATYKLLRSSGLKGEVEGCILPTQDQSLFTRNHHAYILHNGADSNADFAMKSSK